MGQNGGRRPGSGRKPKGANRFRKEAEKAVNWEGQTPAEFFREVMQDATNPSALRLEAAKAGAIYVHKKQPQAQELITPIPLEIAFAVPRIIDEDDEDATEGQT